MKYLFTGDLTWPSWSEARRRILVNMGRDVRSIDFNPFMNGFGRKAGNLQQKLGMGPGIWRYNRSLRSAALKYKPGIMWVDKGHIVKASTLRAIRKAGALLVNFNTDFLRHNKSRWRLHVEGLPEYDWYFTSNALDVEFLKGQGVRNVIVVPLGYYGALFTQPELTKEEVGRLGASVGFIGHWEAATEKLILELSERGLPLRVRGTSWHHAKEKEKLAGIVEPGLVPMEDFEKSIAATKINLGINSAMNHNQTSGRSCEIPAAGGFLLAERTAEHQAMYVEGKEAEFYGSVDELVEKALYYLEHEDKRKEIARRGRERCVKSGNSYEEMMSRIVGTLEDYRA